jgi:hypothetical protein
MEFRQDGANLIVAHMLQTLPENRHIVDGQTAYDSPAKTMHSVRLGISRSVQSC